jgi:uncharacterized membrane protein
MRLSTALNDRSLERVIGNLLRIGVLTAAAVVLVGGIFYLREYGGSRPDYHAFHGESLELRSVSAVLRDLSSLKSPAIIQFGLLLLVFTPIARVVFSAVGFALERDKLYVALTLVVLAVLLYSLFRLR